LLGYGFTETGLSGSRHCCLDTVLRRQDCLDRDSVAWIRLYGDRTVWIETLLLGYGCTETGLSGSRHCRLDTVVRRQDCLDRDTVAWIRLYGDKTGPRHCCLDTVVRRQDCLDRDTVAWIRLYGGRTVWIETLLLGYGCTETGLSGSRHCCLDTVVRRQDCLERQYEDRLYETSKKKSNVSQYLCNVMGTVAGVRAAELQKMHNAHCEQSVCQSPQVTPCYML
jgi:hypothetical protein